VSALLDGAVDQVPLLVLDFETTGLHAARGDRVVEVAAIRREPDGTERVLQSLVQPGVPIPPDAQAIHGIRDADLIGAPGYAQIAPALDALLEGAVLVAHNLPFDKGFLLHEHRRHQLPPPPAQPELDTLALGRHALGLPRCNLASIAARVGLPHHGAHRALNDARTTLAVLLQIARSVDPAGVPTVRQLQARVAELRRGSPQRRRIALLLRAAARAGAELEIDYTSLVPGPLCQRRRVRAQRVGDGWLVGWCHLRGEQRRFRLDRIHRAVRLDLDPATSSPPAPSPG
jgi:DNA polymerase III subunit epsilon